MAKQRIIIGISGASGMPYAERLLQALHRTAGLETHAIVTDGAKKVLHYESDTPLEELTKLADFAYDERRLEAAPASGSWLSAGMIVCPCSMGSLAAIAHGMNANLLQRAADVTLKERRPLVLLTREAPLSAIHLKNMLAVTEAGGTILPASPGFYHRPQSIPALLDHVIGRALDLLHIEHSLAPRWDTP